MTRAVALVVLVGCGGRVAESSPETDEPPIDHPAVAVALHRLELEPTTAPQRQLALARLHATAAVTGRTVLPPEVETSGTPDRIAAAWPSFEALSRGDAEPRRAEARRAEARRLVDAWQATDDDRVGPGRSLRLAMGPVVTPERVAAGLAAVGWCPHEPCTTSASFAHLLAAERALAGTSRVDLEGLVGTAVVLTRLSAAQGGLVDPVDRDTRRSQEQAHRAWVWALYVARAEGVVARTPGSEDAARAARADAMAVAAAEGLLAQLSLAAVLVAAPRATGIEQEVQTAATAISIRPGEVDEAVAIAERKAR